MTEEDFSAKGGSASGGNITNLVNNDGCFDLQFRKDTRRERTNSPTYYRWKVQFIVTCPKNKSKILKKIQKNIGCGKITSAKDQARFSVQKIDDIAEIIVPFFKKNSLKNKKKKNFELWARGVEIIQKNKGKPLISWKKNDLCQLMEIHKSSAKYKKRSRAPKWLDMAKTLSKTA